MGCCLIDVTEGMKYSCHLAKKIGLFSGYLKCRITAICLSGGVYFCNMIRTS